MGQLTNAGYVPERLNTILTELQNGFKRIYGNDINLDPDSPDGQMVGLFAQTRADLEELAEAIYQALDPDHASGAWLEQRVAYAGLIRRQASYSHLYGVILTGLPATKIMAGTLVSDIHQVRWQLESDIQLNAQGSAKANFRSQELGAYYLPANSELKIETVILGWHSAVTAYPAKIGEDEESDVQLRRRFFRSRAKQAQNSVDGLLAALGELPDVKEVLVRENSTHQTDQYGIPPHSINVIIDGGDNQQIAETIFSKKTAGTGLFGQTTCTVRDDQQIKRMIFFDRPQVIHCCAKLTIYRNHDFINIDSEAIKQAISSMVFSIGQPVNLSRMYTPINQIAGFWVDELLIGIKGQPLKNDNIRLDTRSLARFESTDIEVIVR